METEYNSLYSIDDICGSLGIGKTTAYKLLKKEISAFKIGNKWKCRKEDLENYIREQQDKRIKNKCQNTPGKH